VAGSPLAIQRSAPVHAHDVEARLGRTYNRVALSSGAIAGMSAVLKQALKALSSVTVDERQTFSRATLVWANEMRLQNPDIQSAFHRFRTSRLALVANFSTADIPWKRADTVYAIGQFTWNGRAAYRVACKGEWNKGAWFDPDARTWSFADFRCSFSQRGRTNSTFRAHVLNGKALFSTSDWHGGVVPGAGTSTGGAKTACSDGGVTLDLSGVDCSTARNVYEDFVGRTPPPSGWSCQRRRCDGPPDFTGIRVSFTW
jgi:hypothetical protein